MAQIRLLLLIPTLVFLLSFSSTIAATITYNIVNFGAKPNGEIDSTNAFLTIWGKACGSTEPSTIYVPLGRFLVRSAVFKGKCQSNAITVRIDGTLVAPSNYEVIGNNRNWLMFDDVDGVSIVGGAIDGQGTGLWACKNSGKSCPSGATNLRFTNSNNILINGLTSLNSQLFHIVIDRCHNMKVQGANILAAGNSPNTDGIHVQLSSLVTILDTNIATGDDCISVGPGTTDLWIEDITCGPGHGISLLQALKMVRIKSWGRPSNGSARDILFQHATMINVQNPIVIDQNYCPNQKDCPGEISGVEISNVMYQDIHGTSATEVAVKFNCSPKYPCTEITLEDVKLTYENKPAEASCNHAAGNMSGLVQPNSCL